MSNIAPSSPTHSTLSSPLSFFRTDHLVERGRHGWGVFILSWIYLTITQPKELLWFDSGELALAAHSWGIGHPPGQPLYTLLGALSSILPGSPLFWLNQLSVISLCLCLPALYSIWRSIGGQIQWITHLCALLLILVYPVWDQGARVEVYSLASMLSLWAIAWCIQGLRVEKGRPSIWCGLCLGACGAVNPIFAIGIGISILWAIKHQLKRWCVPLFISTSLGFLIPHLYFLWAVTSSQGFIWGVYDNWGGVIHFFSGADYGHTGHSAWSNLISHSIEWGHWALFKGALIWVCVGWLGWLTSPLRPHLMWFIPSWLFGAIFPLSYENYWPEVPDFSGYLLTPICLGLIGLWALLHTLLSNRSRLLLMGLIILSLFVSTHPPHQRSRHHHQLALTLAHHWLNALPPKSLLFVSSDHWVFPLMYAQTVQKVRPDILLFNVGFERSSWYWRWLAQHHPNLPRLESAGTQRLSFLIKELSHRPAYAESLHLATRLGGLKSCPAVWGLSVNCAHPLPFPQTEQLRGWASISAHNDPITRRVLADIGWSLSLHAWAHQDAQSAVELGYAALGKTPPEDLPQPILWWPAPPRLWVTLQSVLIGSPEALHVLLDVLTGRPPNTTH